MKNTSKTKRMSTVKGLLEVITGETAVPWTLGEHHDKQAYELKIQGEHKQSREELVRAEKRRARYEKYKPVENFSVRAPRRIQYNTIRNAIVAHFRTKNYEEEERRELSRTPPVLMHNPKGDAVYVSLMFSQSYQEQRIFASIYKIKKSPQPAISNVLSA